MYVSGIYVNGLMPCLVNAVDFLLYKLHTRFPSCSLQLFIQFAHLGTPYSSASVITNFPFLSSNIPSLPAYGVFISQLIRYARACSSYECFILRAARLSSKLLGQGYVMERLKSSLRKVLWSIWGSHQTLWSPPLPNITWHSGTWPYTMTHSIDQTLHQFTNLLPNWTLLPILTLLPNFGGFHRTLQRVRLANRGRLLLRTPGPVPFGTCICSNVETILSWTCHVYGPFESRTSLGTSILLLMHKQ